MSRAYSDIAFTPAVRAVQTRMGSRSNYEAFDRDENRYDRLSSREAEFIAARDGFYQATVSESGWPYVQFRGGPAGFLKVLDDKTLGYADFRGNVQYISVGNFANNNRISIILMDYGNRARLKILGRVRVVGLDDDPALITQLELPSYRARIERGVIITVEGYDWNCPQHITPRFTEAEVSAATAPLREELAQLKTKLIGSSAPNAATVEGERAQALGRGPLALVIAGVRQLTPRVRAFELRTADGATIPGATPGAHLDVPVRLAPRAAASMRRYSITRVSPAADRIEIAVQRDDNGGGGSMAVHRDYQLGMTLHCSLPGNDFELHDDERPAVLIAGGIGITPIFAMAQALADQGRRPVVHYGARSRGEAALLEPLEHMLGAALRFYASDTGSRLDVPQVFAEAAVGSVFYVCGPSSLIDAVRAAARDAGVAADRVRVERFAAAPMRTEDRALRVTLRRSGKVVEVGKTQSVLDAVQAAGVDTPSACRAGTCGTCAVKVLAGVADHRDSALSDAEREQAGLMCICVSRAISPTLTLDL